MDTSENSPVLILPAFFCHISRKYSAIHKVFPAFFVSSDEKISNCSEHIEFSEVP